MNSALLRLACVTLILSAVAIPTHSVAAEKSPAAPATKTTTSQKKSTRYPIHGKLSAVNVPTKTFSLKGAEKDRVFKVTPETKITKHGKPAGLTNAVVGEDVGGYVEKQPDGTIIALSVRFGPKPEPSSKPESKTKKPEKAEPSP